MRGGKPYFVCAYPPRTSDLVGDEVWKGHRACRRVRRGAWGCGDGRVRGHRRSGRKRTAGGPGTRAGCAERRTVRWGRGTASRAGRGVRGAHVGRGRGAARLRADRTGRDPVASLYLAEAEWDAEATAGRRGTSGWSAGRGDNGPARSVSREPCGEGPFTRRWEARNGSCLTVALLAPGRTAWPSCCAWTRPGPGVAPGPWGAGRKSSIGSHAPRPSDPAKRNLENVRQ